MSRKSIGVIGPLPLVDFRILKRAALLFDDFLSPKCDEMIGSIKSPVNRNEAEWLLENEILRSAEFSPNPNPSVVLSDERKGLLAEMEEYSPALERLMNSSFPRQRPLEPNQQDVFNVFFNLFTRAIAVTLREHEQIEALPILLPYSKNRAIRESSNKTDVVRIILDTALVPIDSTAWEQISDYKNDPDSRQRFLDLRNWINEVSKQTLTPIEIEQKFEYLMSQYERHLKLHKIKTKRGKLETCVVTTLEVAENLAKIKWGKVAKALFAFRKEEVELLQNELSMPGHEVSYLFEAIQKLKNNDN